MSTVLTFDSKAVFDFYDLAKIKEHRYHSYDLCFNAFKIFLKKMNALMLIMTIWHYT